MLKKIIHLTALSYLSLTVSQAAATTKQDTSYPAMLHSLYIEGAGGWTFSNWQDSLHYIFSNPTTSRFNQLQGGGTFGGDVGYKLNPYFAIEVGAFGLPKVSYTISSNANPSVDTGSITNWLIDFAGKVTVPVSPVTGLDIFGKFGVAYRAGNFVDNEIVSPFPPSTDVIQPTVFNIIEPILGGGLQYHLNNKWTINSQYLFLPYGILSTTILGPAEQDHISIPAAQLLTAGISYQF